VPAAGEQTVEDAAGGRRLVDVNGWGSKSLANATISSRLTVRAGDSRTSPGGKFSK
jgi:hypothetical protein